MRCRYLKCSGDFPGQEHDGNDCRGYCCWYCKALDTGIEARAGKRKHYKGHCTGDHPECQFCASPSIEEGRPAAASSTGELPGDESARRIDDDDDSFQDSSSDNEAAAASCGAEIPPPESLGEVHREDAAAAGMPYGCIVEQQGFAPHAMRQSGEWAFDLLCRTSKSGSLQKAGSTTRHFQPWNLPLQAIRTWPRHMAAPPVSLDHHPMLQGKTEEEDNFQARTERRQNNFEKYVVWKKEGSAEEWHPPAGPESSLVCPGPQEGGALDFSSVKMAIVQTTSEEEQAALLAVLPRCRKHLDYLTWDARSGLKRPAGCKAGKACSRPHALSARDPYGDIDPKQLSHFKISGVTNGISILPAGNLARKRNSRGITGLSFQMRPPIAKALQEFFKKHGLLNMLDTAHLQEDAMGRQCVRLRVLRGISMIGQEAEKLGNPANGALEDTNVVRPGERLDRSSTTVPELTYHGTHPDVFLDILRSGGLMPGNSYPNGVYLCPDARCAEMSMYNRGLVVVCKTSGFPYNHEKNRHKLQDKDSIPNGCLGYLRNVLQVKQICAHPRCLQIEEFVFQLDSLVKMVDAELEALGYTQKYHEHMTNLLTKVQDRWRVIEDDPHSKRQKADKAQ